MVERKQASEIGTRKMATEIKLFGKWSLDDIEVSDLALAVRFSFPTGLNLGN